MKKTIVSLVGVVATTCAGAALADTTTVTCNGYVPDHNYLITLSEEDTAAIQENVGTGADFEKAVCEASSQLPIGQYEDPTRVTVTVQPSGNEYTVLVAQQKASE
jgi:hypothetical protein